MPFSFYNTCIFLLFACNGILQEVEDRTARNRVLSKADRVYLEMLCDRGSVELEAINWIGRDFARWMIDDRLMELLFSAEFPHTETLKR